MSLKILKKHLLVNDRRMTVLDEMPADTTPDFVRATLAAKQAQYAREERRKARKQAKAEANAKA